MASKELQAVIEMVKAGEIPKEAGIEERRALMEAGSAMVPLAQDVRCEPVDAGGITAEYVSVPESDEGRVIYYLHGGGYSYGSIITHRELVSRLARAARARVLIINYRLAPENPFPAGLEDSVTGYGWLLSTGIKPDRVVIAGDSAGGGLTAATLLALKNKDLPLPAAGVCISPWVDMACTGQSYITNADIDPFFTLEMLKETAGDYLGGTDPRTPLASPIYADLAGLPSLLIMVGTAEMLFDDATRLAEKAEASGVPVMCEPWEDMIHDWPVFAYMLPEGQQAVDRIGEFVIEHTG